MIKAVVTGAAGRMGSRIINVLSTSEGISLASGAVSERASRSWDRIPAAQPEFRQARGSWR